MREIERWRWLKVVKWLRGGLGGFKGVVRAYRHEWWQKPEYKTKSCSHKTKKTAKPTTLHQSNNNKLTSTNYSTFIGIF